MSARVLVLGAEGMLGHQVLEQLRLHLDAIGTTRQQNRGGSPCVDATDIGTVERVLGATRPSIVVNCIGVVRQRWTKPGDGIAVNALFPHALAEVVRRHRAHLVHFSTDCVFSGRNGSYVETDAVDPVDAYGMTKALGELLEPHVTTIRTTFVGRELRHRTGLLEWFLHQRACRGVRQHYFSVMTTRRIGHVLATMIEAGPPAPGLYHLAGPRVAKHDFLTAVRDAFALDIDIIPDDTTRCDRSLNGELFRRTFGFATPTMKDILQDLSHDLRR